MAGKDTRWQKGVSGNPGGRKKRAAHLLERALDAVDQHVLDAWIDEIPMRQRTIMTGGGPYPMMCRGPDWVQCSKLLAAYALGKPVQMVETRVVEPEKMSDEELRKAAIDVVRQLDQEGNKLPQ